MSVYFTNEELNAYPSTRGMCKYGAIFLSEHIFCAPDEPKKLNEPKIIVLCLLAIAIISIIIIIVIFEINNKKIHNTNLNTNTSSGNSDIPLEHIEPPEPALTLEEEPTCLPVYTQVADPNKDIGVYDGNGNFVELKNPGASYNRELWKARGMPPSYYSQLEGTSTEPFK